jgi:hypothetical protein
MALTYTSPAGTNPMPGDTLVTPGSPLFAEQHCVSTQRALKPRARNATRQPPKDITGALTVAAAAAAAAACGTVTCVGGKAPIAWALANNDGGNFAINASTGAVTKLIAGALTVGTHVIVVKATDARGGIYTESMPVTVT